MRGWRVRCLLSVEVLARRHSGRQLRPLLADDLRQRLPVGVLQAETRGRVRVEARHELALLCKREVAVLHPVVGMQVVQRLRGLLGMRMLSRISSR